jgi:hypothetical protein
MEHTPDDEREQTNSEPAPDELAETEHTEGTVTEVHDDVGDPDASDVDDAEDTDHLARLADPDVAERARDLDERNERYEGGPDDAAGTD